MKKVGFLDTGNIQRMAIPVRLCVYDMMDVIRLLIRIAAMIAGWTRKMISLPTICLIMQAVQ